MLHLKKPLRQASVQTLRNAAKGAGATAQWVPHSLYDQKTYVAAGGAGLELAFFDRVSSDKTLCNMTQPNKISTGHVFVPERAFIHFVRPASLGAGEAGLLNDIDKVIKSARGIVTMTFNGKPHGPNRMHLFGSSGSAEGYIAGSLTAPATVQGGNGPRNGGFPLDGEFVISDEIEFGLSIKFQPAAVAISADLDICVEYFGQLLKPVA